MDIEDVRNRIRAGDRQAFAEVVREYQRPLFGFLGRMGLSRAQTEDLAQEAFLRAWRNLEQYRPGLSRFSTWLYAIARNLALNELERATSRPMVREEAPEPVCERPRPDESLDAARRRRMLHQALGQLALPDRSVLALAYLADLNIAEIARIEGCSEGAVKTRLSRARGRLSDILEKDHV
jgi:RNA polymerase sigma-70 factor, ECF subfamily